MQSTVAMIQLLNETVFKPETVSQQLQQQTSFDDTTEMTLDETTPTFPLNLNVKTVIDQPTSGSGYVSVDFKCTSVTAPVSPISVSSLWADDVYDDDSDSEIVVRCQSTEALVYNYHCEEDNTSVPSITTEWSPIPRSYSEPDLRHQQLECDDGTEFNRCRSVGNRDGNEQHDDEEGEEVRGDVPAPGHYVNCQPPNPQLSGPLSTFVEPAAAAAVQPPTVVRPETEIDDSRRSMTRTVDLNPRVYIKINCIIGYRYFEFITVIDGVLNVQYFRSNREPFDRIKPKTAKRNVTKQIANIENHAIPIHLAFEFKLKPCEDKRKGLYVMGANGCHQCNYRDCCFAHSFHELAIAKYIQCIERKTPTGGFNIKETNFTDDPRNFLSRDNITIAHGSQWLIPVDVSEVKQALKEQKTVPPTVVTLPRISQPARQNPPAPKRMVNEPSTAPLVPLSFTPLATFNRQPPQQMPMQHQPYQSYQPTNGYTSSLSKSTPHHTHQSININQKPSYNAVNRFNDNYQHTPYY
jgi:hypothetical protein